jgi:hypothetical protein
MGKYAELASGHSSGKYAELAAQAPKFNKDEQRGRELPSPAQGAIAAISNGMLGFGDEAYGALGGLGAIANNAYGAIGGDVQPLDVKNTYLENRDLIRGAQKQYAQDYPVTNAVTGIMAGAPLMAFNPVKAAQLPQATTKMEAVFNAAKLAAQSAKTGAVYGGAYGLGSSDADTAGGVAGDVATNAALGGAVGGVAQPIASAVAGLGKNLAIRAFGNVKNTGGINQAGGQTGAIDPIGGLVDKSQEWIKRQGDAKIAEALAQTGRARNKNIRLLPNGEQVPYSTILAERVDKMPVGTPLASLSGQKSNELRSLDAVSLLSGRTAPAVSDVQGRLAETASKRYLNYADKVLGGGKPDFNKSIAALNTKATVESKPYYEILQTVNVPIDGEVRDLVQRASRYASKANQMAKLEGEDFTDILRYVKPESGQTQIPLMQLERLKRAMNGAIGTAKAGGDSEFARSILTAKNALMSKLEQVSPTTQQGESVYRLANQKFAEPKQLIDAVEEGANIFKKNHMDIRDYKATLNDPQKQAYEIGVFRALEEKMGTPSGRNFLSEISKNRNTSQSLLEAMGKDRFRQFAGMMKGEKALKGIYSVNTGSQTAQREAALSELGLDPLKDAGESVANLIGGNPLTAMGKAGQAWNKISTPEQVRDYMGKQYLLTGKESKEYLKTLGDLMKQIETKKTQRATATGTLSGLGGGQFNKPKDKK